MNYKTKVYPNGGINSTVENSDQTKKNIGFCFSGGGSRALTCGWGQMLGLDTLNLMNDARYISSVSGGTWATSIYSYLPNQISDKDLLGQYYKPENLSLKNQTGNLNVNTLNEFSLGKAPEGMQLGKLILKAATFLVTTEPSHHKWLWAYIVGDLVLEPYNLRAKGTTEWNSSKFFSLSEKYADHNFNENSPSKNDFFFLRSGRPFHIMNNNMMLKVENSAFHKSNIVQVPNQVTPVAGGARGKAPIDNFNGGGLVETYGVGSTLSQPTITTPDVNIEISQPYSLIDIVSTSSAFFAEFVASYIKSYLSDTEKKQDLINEIESKLTPEHKASLLNDIEDGISDVEGIYDAIKQRLEAFALKETSLFADIVPSYNYWPIQKNSQNKEMQYTDGGTLDNTGVLGMLSQTDLGTKKMSAPIRLVAFDNTERTLEKKDGKIITATQIAPLFGIDFDGDTGVYQPFTEDQKNIQSKNFSAQSLTHIFDNSKGANNKTPFDELVEGIYASSCGALLGDKPDDSKVCTSPAFHQIQLTTIQNDLANITANRNVEILYVQNAKILNWQNNIGDAELKAQIIAGQKQVTSTNTKEKLEATNNTFRNFPYYSTFYKIGLEPKESNALSQMWAWAVSDNRSPLKTALSEFINSDNVEKQVVKTEVLSN